MADLLRRIAGVRLGIATQVFTTLLILTVGYLVIERNLRDLVLSARPISPYQLRMVLLDIRTEVLIIAFVAFVSGLVLTFTIQREVKRAIRGVRKASHGFVEPELPKDLSREFIPLNTAIQDLGESLGRFLRHTVTDAIVLVGEALQVETLNGPAEALFGYRSEEVRGKPLSLLFPEDQNNRELYRRLQGGDKASGNGLGTGSALHRQGKWVPVRLGIFQVQREARPLRGIVAGVFDEKEWNRIREEFERADRLSNLGLLITGLAHEIKNPLGSVQGLVQLLAEEFPATHPRRKYCDTILEEVGRLDTIMKRLLDLASPARWRKEVVSLSAVAEEVGRLMEVEARRRGVELRGEPGVGDGRIIGDPDRIKQALINVVKNAIEATPQGGIVTWQRSQESPWVVISVINPGLSFPTPLGDRIPTVMASSKAGGSGLGLAITQQILHQHGGKLEAENREEGGARVRLFLPAAPPGQDAGQAVTAPETSRDGMDFPGEGARA